MGSGGSSAVMVATILSSSQVTAAVASVSASPWSRRTVQRGPVSADEAAKAANWSFPPLQQAGVRHTWDGEQAIGMLERSNMPEYVEAGDCR
jgi:hypothetical protein